MKLFEMLEYIRSDKTKGWSVKTNKLELGLSSMKAEYSLFNGIKCTELGSLEGSGSRDDTTTELARTAI
jgi:hypothetical protein